MKLAFGFCIFATSIGGWHIICHIISKFNQLLEETEVKCGYRGGQIIYVRELQQVNRNDVLGKSRNEGQGIVLWGGINTNCGRG